MRTRSPLRLIVGEIVAIAINVIPLLFWFFDDLSAESTMLIYAVEALAAVVFAILCVLLISPAQDPDGRGKYKKKRKLIADFSIIAFGFLGVLGIFVGLFLFLVLKIEFDFRSILIAVAILIAFQVAELFIDILTLRPLPLKKAEFLLSKSMGKTAVLFFGVFLGIFLAAWANEWFIVPLVVVKTLIDVGEPIQFFLGKDEAEASIFETNINFRSR